MKCPNIGLRLGLDSAVAAAREPVIAGACRTAIGALGGGLAAVPAWRLGAVVIEAALERAGLPAGMVDEVLMGSVLTAGQGQGPARRAAVSAGLPHQVPASCVNMVCGSGLRAVTMAAQSILLGQADAVVAGGMENMSQAPYLLPQARSGYRLGNGALLDSMISDGLWCALTDQHMGSTAEALADKYRISRQDQDAFALRSQRLAAAAIAAGRFAAETVPVPVPGRRGALGEFARDEHPRPDVDESSLARLRPAFREGGTVTAGNASGINDGAAAVVVAARGFAQANGLPILGRIVSYAYAGVDPGMMGIGPVDAVHRALAAAGITPADLELAELNEAFAVQSLAVLKDTGIDPAIVNVNGGAIALGHPIGASGARVLVTLLHEMQRRDCGIGLAALCIGGGMGIAVVVERV